jgi:hypothetical protein
MISKEKSWQKIANLNSLKTIPNRPNEDLITILDENIVEINLTGLTPSFFKQFNHPRELHRVISNGKQSIGAYTNREFWNDYVKGGFYTYDFHNNLYSITYCVFLEVGKDMTKFNRQFILRLKKLLFTVNVTIAKSNLINYQEQLEAQQKDFSGFHKFGLN